MSESANHPARLRRPHAARRLQSRLRKLVRDRRGATMLETVLLLAAIVIPGYVVIRLALRALLGYYHMMATLIDLPFP